ncbi:MAG TPA: type IV toxin-antitoxin system AbiEi family antitoxin domain-containing protein [Thermoleophilaceae bacterium]|nr:type IV toxin-antitoxin system AbiEi family antitoxin domain-containing protein [Thermoleophilaceae bacterium]
MASRAHGVVTRAELLDAGLTPKEIKWRVRTGLLIPLYRGVYRVGHVAPSVEADYMAAVKACGDGALLSGRAAGWIEGLIRGRPPKPEVIAPTERRIPGLRCRRARKLDPRDHTTHKGIPVTTVAKTTVDLAATLPYPALARAFHEAGIRHQITPEDIEEVLTRKPNAKRAKQLRAIIWGDSEVTLSRLEDRFIELLKADRLDLPVTNRPAGGRYVDCRWPEHTLTVELDSYTYHRSRHAWEEDRKRERQARARGDDFRRFTWGDVFERPAATLREMRVALAAGEVYGSTSPRRIA